MQIQRNSAWSFVCFFLFDGRIITGSVDKKHFNGKLFSQILDCANIISLIKKESKGRRECLR